MSRGGRGGGRGGKRGPDLSWDDEETAGDQTLDKRRPQPLFPTRYIVTPKSLDSSEKSAVSSFLSFRDRVRRGPLYAVLDPAVTVPVDSTADTGRGGSYLHKTQQTTVKPNARAGFDPFNDQEKYTLKYHRKRRTYPDLAERECYTLKLFPTELWSVLDPQKRMPEWGSLTEEQKTRISGSASGAGKGTKRKRAQALKFDDAEDGDSTKKPRRRDDSEGSDDEEDEDVLTGGRKRKDKEKKKERTGKQKKGLDAEDDYPEVDQQDDDAEGDGGAEDEPQDSEFDSDGEDEEGGDDYNAEQYFDDGADDLMDGDGGDDDGGGVF